MIPIEVEHLRREWPQARGAPIVAVADATFQVQAGEAMGLLGPNGAGKSTLMQVLATLTPPTSGTARVAGFDVGAASREVRSRMGYLSTTSGLPSRLTVRECLVLFAGLHDLPRPKEAAQRAIASFRLEEIQDRYVEGLSTGLKQRLRIACAFVHGPPVLILDEPTAGLDLMTTDALLEVLKSLRDQGTAVLYSTHRMEEAQVLCDRVAVLYEGRLLAVDSLAGLEARTGTSSLGDAFRRLVAP